MSTFTRRGFSKVRTPILLVSCVFLLACGHRQKEGKRLADEDAVIREAVTVFRSDWGLPSEFVASRPAAVPSSCYLVDRFLRVTETEGKLLRERSPHEAGAAVTDLEKKASGSSLQNLATPCALIADPFSEPEPWQRLKRTRDDRVGILEVSRVGITLDGQYPALIIRESRADIAGATWEIFLQRIGSTWQVVGRALLEQS